MRLCLCVSVSVFLCLCPCLPVSLSQYLYLSLSLSKQTLDQASYLRDDEMIGTIGLNGARPPSFSLFFSLPLSRARTHFGENFHVTLHGTPRLPLRRSLAPCNSTLQILKNENTQNTAEHRCRPDCVIFELFFGDGVLELSHQ